jgi:hypothetical protein
MIGLRGDYATLWSILITNPVNLFCFLSLPRWLKRAIEGLRDNRVIGELIARNGNKKDLDSCNSDHRPTREESSTLHRISGSLGPLTGIFLRIVRDLSPKAAMQRITDLDSFLIDFDRAYTHPIWAVAAAGIAIGMAVGSGMLTLSNPGIWMSTDDLFFAYWMSWMAIAYYVLVLLVIRVAVAITWFGHLFRGFKITVRGLHPDTVGGFSPFGQLVTRVGVLIGVYGLTLVVYWFHTSMRLKDTSNPTLHWLGYVFLALLFFCLAPTVFFLLVRSAHQAMKGYKDGLESQADQQLGFDALLARAASTARRYELRRDALALERIQKVHKMIVDLPEWPLDTGGIVRFYTVVLSPVVMGIVVSVLATVLSERVQSLLGGG